MKHEGKYQRRNNNHRNAYAILISVAVLIVFSISAVVFYKAGEKSAVRSQESENRPGMTIQEAVVETSQVTVSITEATIETTEATEETILPTTKPTQPTEATQLETESTKPATRTGTVLRSAGELNIRSGAGTNYSEIGRLKGGEEVTIYEEKTAGGTVWGNIGYGWISMDYIVFGTDTSVDSTYIGSVIRKDDYFGDWLSSDGKCYMSIIRNGNGANISVISTITDNVDMTWSMYGEFDEHGAIRYWNGIRKDHNLGVESLKYTNGEGAIVLDGLSLSWHESAEGPGEAGRFEKVYNYTPNNGNSGENQNGGNTSNTGNGGRVDNNTVLETVFSTVKKKISGAYSGAQVLYHSASYSNGYVSYNPNNGIYSCSMTAEYCTNIFDIWGTSTSTYFVNAELIESNGKLTITKIDIQ